MRLLIVDQECQLHSDRALYRELAKLSDEPVTLVTPRLWPRLWGMTPAEPAEVSSLRIVPASVLFRGRQHRVVYRNLGRVLGTAAPDIVYVNAEPESWLAWQIAGILSRSSRKTSLVLTSWRNIDFPGGRFPYKLWWLNARAEKRSLVACAAIIAKNADAVGVFRGRGFDRVRYIQPAVDTSLFSPGPRRQSRDPQPLRVGFIGRFDSLKGGEVLLRAMKGVERVTLRMIGAGPREQAWKRLADDLGLSSTVSWIPPVRQDLLPGEMHQLDTLVLPSQTGPAWKEQFGRVLAEAMSCGLAVIGSSSGEIPRVIGEEGVVVPESDVLALRSAIELLRDDPILRRNFGERGRAKIVREYSVGVTARLFHSYLSSIIR